MRARTLSADDHRIGALALGDGDGDGGRNSLGPPRDAHVLGRLFAAIAHFGDVADEDRLVVGHAGHYVAHIFGGTQKLAGFEEIFAVAAIEIARRKAPVGKPQRTGDLQRRKIVGGELACIQNDADLAPLRRRSG